MKLARTTRRLPVLAMAVFSAGLPCEAAQKTPVSFAEVPGKLLLYVGGKPLATYVYADQEIPRPYFAHVRAPGGIQVTRNHPPVRGKDPTDHATYHPGIWMAFGDLSGSDYWRNRARVVHERFVEEPAGGPGKGGFTVRNCYLADDQRKIVCQEECRYTVYVRPSGYLFIWDSTFSAAAGQFYFGDQEEMGLGVRVTSPIRVEAGGTILDARGRKNGKQVWGNAADWCNYSGALQGRHVGVTLMCHPANFRPSWFHARDYGLLLANPFGRKAFDKGDASKVVVKRGEKFRLRYGVLLHAGPEGSRPDLNAAYADYLQLVAK